MVCSLPSKNSELSGAVTGGDDSGVIRVFNGRGLMLKRRGSTHSPRTYSGVGFTRSN